MDNVMNIRQIDRRVRCVTKNSYIRGEAKNEVINKGAKK